MDSFKLSRIQRNAPTSAPLNSAQKAQLVWSYALHGTVCAAAAKMVSYLVKTNPVSLSSLMHPAGWSVPEAGVALFAVGAATCFVLPFLQHKIMKEDAAALAPAKSRPAASRYEP